MKGGSNGGLYYVEVLPCNWKAVQLFKKCQLSYVGMAGTCVGLSTSEIRSVLEVFDLPRRSWKSLAAKLLFMGQEAADYLNQSRKE